MLYSPFGTFGKVIKTPNLSGPILLLLITLPLTFGVQYISSERLYLEFPTPELDLWTEAPSTSAPFSWSPNDSIIYDAEDRIHGNYSVSTSSINSPFIAS